MEKQAILQAVAKLFEHADAILLTAAENLDGDALGCLLALEAYARSRSKDVDVVNSRPVPPNYAYLGVSHRVFTSIPENKKYDLIVVCDTGDIRMIGRLYEENPELFEKTPLVNIDHHGSDYGDVCWMDPQYSSACDMVAEFIEYSGGIEAVTPEIANFLMLGVLYDTGCFRNTNTYASTFERSAKLMARGVDYMSHIRSLFQSSTLEYAHFVGEAISSLFAVGGGRGVGAVLTNELFVRHGIDPYALGNELVNDYVRSVKADFVFLVKEVPEGGFRLSFRSKKDDVDVRKIACQFSGGGHMMAAGGKSDGPVEEIIAKIEAFAKTLP